LCPASEAAASEAAASLEAGKQLLPWQRTNMCQRSRLRIKHINVKKMCLLIKIILIKS